MHNEMMIPNGSGRTGVIATILLAAGRSRRMGRCKLLLPFGSSTVLETAIRHATMSEVDKVVVVLGAHNATLSRQLQSLPAEIVINPEPASEMINSLRCGLRALPPPPLLRAFIVALADQPFITSNIFNAIVNAFNETHHGIIIPTYRGKRGHPVMLDGRYRELLLTYTGECGLRSFMHEHSDDIYELPMNDDAIVRDIDTLDDYYRELERWKACKHQ